MKEKNWLRFHERNIITEKRAILTKIAAGEIIRFNYKGIHARVKMPMVLVLNPFWRGKVHAVSLDVISDSTLVDLYKIVRETIGAKAQKLLKLRLPLIKADIKDPEKFYHTRLKRFIKQKFESNTSPYRTYIRTNMTNIRVIDYRFKDMDIATQKSISEQKIKLI